MADAAESPRGAGRDGGRGQRRPARGIFREGTLPVDQIIDGFAKPCASGASRRCCALRPRTISAPICCSISSWTIFPRPPIRVRGKASLNGKDVERAFKDSEPVSAFVFKTVADPFAGRVSYFKVISGVVKNDAHLMNSRTGGAERLAHIGAFFGKDHSRRARTARGRYRRRRQAARHADRRYAGRQGLHDRVPGSALPEPSIAYAIAAKTRNDEDRMGNAIHKILEEDPPLRFYRDPQTKEFLLAGYGTAARRNHRQPPEETLRRGSRAARAENSVSRNHSRQGRGAGTPQEADRRPRPVRRLLDSHGAAAAGSKVRIRERGLRRRDPQKLHPGDRKRHHRNRRERLSWPAFRWSISR